MILPVTASKSFTGSCLHVGWFHMRNIISDVLDLLQVTVLLFHRLANSGPLLKSYYFEPIPIFFQILFLEQIVYLLIGYLKKY